jgi:putative ABC transport system permease protein
MGKTKGQQPKLGKRLLAFLTHYEDEFSSSGDLGEEFEERVFERGRSRALLWYWGQVLHAVWCEFRLSIWFGGAMIKNFVKITLRNIKRQKLYAFINIAGLAVGLIVCILMVLYIRFELTFDDFHENADRIYRINAHDLGRDLKFAGTQALLASTLKKDFPEVKYAARLVDWRGYLRYTGRYKNQEKDTMFSENRFFCVDPDFKDIFTYPLVMGDAEALKEPFVLFITQKLADKYFRGENPIGKTLSFNNRHDFIIKGILKDVPENSYLQFDLLTSMATLKTLWGEEWLNRWISHDFNTFVMLEKNADPALFEEKLGKFIRPVDMERLDQRDVYFSQPLKKIHFGAGLRSEEGETNDIRYIYILSATVLLILLIACFNYTTLATARATKRMREIGLRKVVGAGRVSLIRQFLGESILFALLAFAIAVLSITLLLPWFNHLMNRNLAFSAASDLPAFLFVSLLVGVAAGLYPAFYLSSFQPTRLFRGILAKDSGSSSILRKSLVVTQFVITIALITCLLIIKNQIHYLTKNSMRDFDNVIVTVALNDEELRANYQALHQAFKQSPQVLDSTVSYSHPLNISWGMGLNWDGIEEGQFARIGPVDFNYIDFYGLKIKRGRKMMEDMSTDRAEAVILNETAAKASPWEDPIGKRCQFDSQHGVVIGIVEDFHFKSLYNQVEPLAMRHLYEEGHAGGAGYISLKISAYDIPGTLKYLEDTWEKFSSYFPFQYAFLDETIDSVYRTEIRLSHSLTSFTAIAIFLACLGLFGLTSFTAERRTKEIGIRKVLGASPKGIFLMLSKDIVKWVVLAAVGAFPLAYYAMQEWLKRFAYRTDISAGIFALATAFSLLIALLAMSYQSVKAATTDPVDSLRYE